MERNSEAVPRFQRVRLNSVGTARGARLVSMSNGHNFWPEGTRPHATVAFVDHSYLRWERGAGSRNRRDGGAQGRAVASRGRASLRGRHALPGGERGGN